VQAQAAEAGATVVDDIEGLAAEVEEQLIEVEEHEADPVRRRSERRECSLATSKPVGSR
jgi:hypothetical protein